MDHNEFERPVWVSYTSADQDFVERLTAQVTGYAPQKGQLPFYLNTYKRNSVSSEPVSRLSKAFSETQPGVNSRDIRFLLPGESIIDLVNCIAGNLRRLCVISSVYLKQAHCLWELCACLCASQQTIFFILIDVERKHFSGEKTVDGNTLAELLGDIYEKRLVPSNPHLKQSCCSDRKSIISYFQRRLDECMQHDYESLTKEQARSPDTALLRELAGKLCLYVNRMSPDCYIKNYEKFLTDEWDRWVEGRFATKCTAAQNDTANKFATLLRESENIDKKWLKKWEGDIKSEYHNYADKEGALSEIRRLCGLVSLCMIDGAWAGEVLAASPQGRYSRIAVKGGSSPGSEKGSENREEYTFKLARAACAVYGSIPRVKQCDSMYGIQVDEERHFFKYPARGPEELHQKQTDREKYLDKIEIELVAKLMRSSEESVQKDFQQGRAWLNALIENLDYDDRLNKHGLVTDLFILLEQNNFNKTNGLVEEQYQIIEDLHARLANEQGTVGPLSIPTVIVPSQHSDGTCGLANEAISPRRNMAVVESPRAKILRPFAKNLLQLATSKYEREQ
ncbi:hypothetical protein [Pseudoalteromonas rubra]|uniref:TIR domain-containing protein n=1 Tax=Pseudoalteromonas rubra TaxID=43658 RepID=A0A5S3WSA5_9GAMM|nr:hypothetical protein [Pseudoalteromonas rubra]TMP32044.1 hypothetical protein CWB98_21905 [Pseudoalteromonas rubra]